MTSKWQFLLHRVDPDANATFPLYRSVARKDECCFREVHLARNGLHFSLVEAGGVVNDGERVSFERLRSEDIKLREWEFPWVACHGDWIGRGGTKVQDFRGESTIFTTEDTV